MVPSTETYLAGLDNLMRSDSRLLLEDPQEYRLEVVATGIALDVVDTVIELGGSTLVQLVPGASLLAAQRGQTGTFTATHYRDNKEMEHQALLTVPNSDLHWSILTTRDDSDASAPLSKFNKTPVLAVAVIFVIYVASMLLAQILLLSIRRLEDRMQKINSGDYVVDIPGIFTRRNLFYHCYFQRDEF